MDYKTVAKVESFGRYAIGVDIQVAVKHELSTAEKDAVREACEKLRMVLYYGAERANPEARLEIEQEKKRLIELFPAGCSYVEKPNGYDGDPNRPWFRVFTLKGPIDIGWRRRVINIDWSMTVCSPATDLFLGEDVTKGHTYIHAWGYDKAQEYINKLLE